MGLLVVLREGRLVAVLPIPGIGASLGMGSDGTPALVPPDAPGCLLRFAPKAGGLAFVTVPGGPRPEVNGRPAEGGTLFAGDLLRLGKWEIHPDPQAGGDDRYQALPARLFELVSAAASEEEPAGLLRSLLDEAVRSFGAERGFVLFRERPSSVPEVVARVGMDPGAADSRISRTALERARTEGRPVLLGDAEQQLREAESVQIEGIRSLLCAPLGDGGALYLDSRGAKRSFGPADLEAFTTFSGFAGLALRLWSEADSLRRRSARLEAQGGAGDGPLLDGSPAPVMQQLMAELEAVAREDVTVLVLGETGTGKEVLARAIHDRSPRNAGPFVAVNCMAFGGDLVASELFGHEKGAFTGAGERRLGRFELADGGTLFLDEVGELSPEIQVKLLRVLQERVVERMGGARPIPVDIRVVAATNRDLEAEVRRGTFREDLYYRLAVFTLRPPPLRERRQDIPRLAEHFARTLGRRMGKATEGLAPDAVAALSGHGWPGNVRELRNVIERALVLERGARITAAALPFGRPPGTSPPGSRLGETGLDQEGESGPEDPVAGFLDSLPNSLPAAKEAFEKHFLARALEAVGGNVAAAARRLEVPRSTVYRKCQMLGIPVKAGPGES